ncbi:proteasome subunit beta type-5 [Drosophila subobscura]|uniref:proteasome subunit beta type-5 n=1 Tax=Drosophila subobscura TaxID=7241 RepID=UPI00155A5DC5|nr:proteasome subunit beta type-5 [Drosophila subobscura]
MSLEQLCDLKSVLPTTSCTNFMDNKDQNLQNFPYRLMPPVPGTPVLSHLGRKVNHGTTTVGFVYQGGIVLCADSRLCNGINVCSQKMNKIVPISKHIVGTLAGGAADCKYWYRVLTRESRLHELRYKQPMSVSAAAKMIGNVSQMHRGTGLDMGMLLAGYGPKGPTLIYVDSEGMNISGKKFAVGSGASNALGILDPMYCFDLSDEQAFELALQCIYQATLCDAYTGGIVLLYRMGPVTHGTVKEVDCMELHKKYSTYALSQMDIDLE